MEALRLVVRQDHVASVQVACGMRKVIPLRPVSRRAAGCGRNGICRPATLPCTHSHAHATSPARPALPLPCLAQLLTPTQWARLVVAAWPFYPDPSKWAPLLVAEAAGGGA